MASQIYPSAYTTRQQLQWVLSCDKDAKPHASSQGFYTQLRQLCSATSGPTDSHGHVWKHGCGNLASHTPVIQGSRCGFRHHEGCPRLHPVPDARSPMLLQPCCFKCITAFISQLHAHGVALASIPCHPGLGCKCCMCPHQKLPYLKASMPSSLPCLTTPNKPRWLWLSSRIVSMKGQADVVTRRSLDTAA